MSGRFARLSPGGSAISLRSIGATMRGGPEPEEFMERLRERLGAQRITLHASGREALRVAFAHAARQTGRDEIVIPAYACYSIPAAAVAARLKVRLVDVDLCGRIDPASLARLPLERAAAVVLGNLFGVPEPIGEVAKLANEAGVRIIDDAAQCLGAQTVEGPVGGRGDFGILSFGRGKPLSALGGGALAWRRECEDLREPPIPRPRRSGAVLRALAYDLARNPFVFRLLSSIPALGIGKTIYDPHFHQGAITGEVLAIAPALLQELDRQNHDRAERAHRLGGRLRHDTPFVPLLATAGDEAIHPRLGVLAPDRHARDAALGTLASYGATRMYPETLDRISALRPDLAGEPEARGAAEFCARLLTLPTHEGLTPRHIEAIGVTLSRLRPQLP